MHLTNYAINKTNEEFSKDKNKFKRSMDEVLEQIAEESGEFDVKEYLWSEIKKLITKTLLSIWP